MKITRIEYLKNTKRYDEDNPCEVAIGKFLDRYFYSRLKEKDFINDFQRVNDLNKQVSGIDMVLDCPGDKCMFIDEKGKVKFYKLSNGSYRPPSSFAFELLMLNKKLRWSKGWFTDKKLKTTHYVIAVPDKDRPMAEDEIEYVKLFIISRQSLFDYFRSHGWSLERLDLMAEKIRDDAVGSDMSVKKTWYDEDTKKGEDEKLLSYDKRPFPFWFSYTGNMVEHPVNVVLSEYEIRKNIPCREYLVKRDHCHLM